MITNIVLINYYITMLFQTNYAKKVEYYKKEKTTETVSWEKRAHGCAASTAVFEQNNCVKLI